MNTTASPLSLHLVCAVSDKTVLAQELLRSPDVVPWSTQAHGVSLVVGAGSAAEAFNPVMQALEHLQTSGWLVWVHQDVHLPSGWRGQFTAALQEAQTQWPNLAVAGVYGRMQDGPQRAGQVWDRGQHLCEDAALPCRAGSLDELLVAVKVGSGLRMDPDLGFDFYATDLCLQARERELTAAVLRAPVSHASRTPREGAVAAKVLDRIARSAEAFERKWAHRLPVFTPCFDIHRQGDVRRFIDQHFSAVPAHE